KKEQQWRQNEFPFAEMMFALCEPEQKQCDRRDESGRGGNRKTGEVLRTVGAGFSFVVRRCGIETRQTQRTTREVNEGDDPTGVRKFVENNAINHQSGREPEGNDVGE